MTLLPDVPQNPQLLLDGYLERGHEIIKLRTCIEEGHDYGEEPTCKRCGHYGPEDHQHLLELENQRLKDVVLMLVGQPHGDIDKVLKGLIGDVSSQQEEFQVACYYLVAPVVEKK